jgi:hypothetical protein
MNLEEAKENYAKFAKIDKKILMFLGDDEESYYFMYEIKQYFFKIAVSKTNDAYYAMSDTLTRKDIDLYDTWSNRKIA